MAIIDFITILALVFYYNILNKFIKYIYYNKCTKFLEYNCSYVGLSNVIVLLKKIPYNIKI